jgi:hypothetical protein
MSEDQLNTQHQEVSKPLKLHYVYILADPLQNNEIFYVGKGTSQRGHDHYKEALRPDAQDSQKIARIKSIHDQGSEPLVRVIGRFDTEDMAYAVESTLIHWVYGLENLANIQPGRGHRQIRSRKEGLIIKLQDIDIPKRMKITGNGYLQEKIDNHARLNHFEMMEELYIFLKEKGIPVEDEGAVIIEGGRYIAISISINPSAKLTLQITDSERHTIILNFRPNSEKIEDRRIFIEFVKETFQIEAKNGGRYAKLGLDSWNNLTVNDHEKIYKSIISTIELTCT